jgi:signal transduction histidine kinase
MNVELQEMEYDIARCRVVLSMAAMLVVYIDPEEPLLAHWIPWISGRFTMDPRLFFVMAAHLAYSVTMFAGSGRVFTVRMAAMSVWIDVLFGVVIGVMTEGVTGPMYPFFTFAVAVSGLRGGMRQAVLATTVSLILYVCVIVISTRGGADVYIMRPVYLAITGYLIGYLGQQRLELQEQMRQLEVAEQRHRIARDLHDGYAQALAGVNLRLEAAREQLAAGASEQVLADLTRLQTSVQHEYDDLRDYVRSLAGVGVARGELPLPRNTRIRLRADFAGSPDRLTNVLSIVREGLSNIVRHASAHSASIEIHSDGGAVRVVIRDDGVGYRGQKAPWSIDSRVREAGGQIRIGRENAGTDLQITLPQQ